MSRKDYVLIAAVLKNNFASYAIIEAFAKALGDANPKFNSAVFIDAATSDNATDEKASS